MTRPDRFIARVDEELASIEPIARPADAPSEFPVCA
jgi:hypothetical protein